MKEYHLRCWSAESRDMETLDSTNWMKVVDLVQITFRDGLISEKPTWQATVLIPKEGGEFQGIGLVEVLWKMVAAFLKRQLGVSITLHDFLNGFRDGCGTGTASLESKLIQQLTAMREEFLCVILLYLNKAYDALDRDRCLDIIKGYGVVLQDLYLLHM